MDSSSQEKEEKKKITNVKTFPVPFALGEIKESIYVSTNTPTKPSKDQLIQQAIQFHSQGNIYEAGKYYKRFLDEGFKDHRVFSNYGIILKSLGKLQDAELLYRKAIEINPDLAASHSNLGIILKDLGKLGELLLLSESTLKSRSINQYKNP